jgi:crotonobetaine/carnitine-CoA ligase
MEHPGRPPIIDLILERRDSHPRAPYLLFGPRVVSWSEFAEASFQVANGLLGLGINPGDRVAIMLPNCPEFLFAYYGIIAMGGATVPVNTAQKGRTLEYVLTHSESVAIVIDQTLAPAYNRIAGDLTDIKVIVSGSASSIPGAISLDSLMRGSSTPPAVTSGAKSGLGILYTSGTTGPPKGVVATGYDLDPIRQLIGLLQVHPGEIVYTCLPLFHGNALILSAMGAIWGDWTLALGARFSASRFWDEVRQYQAVEFNALGAMIPILLKQPAARQDRDHTVRTVLSAACPAWAWTDFQERFGVRLIEFYGLVDHPGYLINDEGVAGSMGKPKTKAEFDIFDDSERPIPPGQVGELVIRHPSGRLTRYHGDHDATEHAYRGGWFHTGDLAYRDENGFYYYAGRKKQSIRRRGENISAWEIENVVNRHPAVYESAAHGVPSEFGEDEVKVVVVLKTAGTLSPEELVEYCIGQMADYAVPRYVEFRSSLPKTGTQRIEYAKLKSEGITRQTWDRLQTVGGQSGVRDG